METCPSPANSSTKSMSCGCGIFEFAVSRAMRSTRTGGAFHFKRSRTTMTGSSSHKTGKAARNGCWIEISCLQIQFLIKMLDMLASWISNQNFIGDVKYILRHISRWATNYRVSYVQFEACSFLVNQSLTIIQGATQKLGNCISAFHNFWSSVRFTSKGYGASKFQASYRSMKDTR